MNAWEEEFDKIFKCNCMLCVEKQHEFSTTAEYMKNFIRGLIEADRKRIVKSLEQEIWAPVPGVDPKDYMTKEYGKLLEVRNNAMQVFIEIVDGKRK